MHMPPTNAAVENANVQRTKALLKSNIAADLLATAGAVDTVAHKIQTPSASSGNHFKGKHASLKPPDMSQQFVTLGSTKNQVNSSQTFAKASPSYQQHALE